MKVVINNCYGGFSLSNKACLRLVELGMKMCSNHEDFDKFRVMNEPYILKFDKPILGQLYSYEDTKTDNPRSHPLLIQVVEELGEEADGPCAKLNIIEIPYDVKYEIEEYDGMEHVAEVHRTWY